MSTFLPYTCLTPYTGHVYFPTVHLSDALNRPCLLFYFFALHPPHGVYATWLSSLPYIHLTASTRRGYLLCPTSTSRRLRDVAIFFALHPPHGVYATWLSSLPYIHLTASTRRGYLLCPTSTSRRLRDVAIFFVLHPPHGVYATWLSSLPYNQFTASMAWLTSLPYIHLTASIFFEHQL